MSSLVLGGTDDGWGGEREHVLTRALGELERAASFVKEAGLVAGDPSVGIDVPEFDTLSPALWTLSNRYSFLANPRERHQVSKIVSADLARMQSQIEALVLRLN